MILQMLKNNTSQYVRANYLMEILIFIIQYLWTYSTTHKNNFSYLFLIKCHKVRIENHVPNVGVFILDPFFPKYHTLIRLYY
jgi:hypothetical protein